MSHRPAKKHEEEEHENHERWLVSYADMITLLAALFIVLFAMSRLDNMKFQKFAHALGASLHGTSGGPASVVDGGGPKVGGGGEGFFDGIAPTQPGTNTAQTLETLKKQQQAAAQEKQTLQATKAEIQSALQKVGLADKVEFKLDSRGLVVNIVTDDVLFDLGSATLRPEGRAVLDGLAPALGELPNQISIEGHTDNAPINTGAFPSNWELSTTRATTVLRYLTDVRGVPESRLAAAGYADQRPLEPNDTVEHRARNRRVEIVVIAQNPSDPITGGS
ncbi:MAG: flagellar motor protein MotB [Acidimicrobiia bacterium]